ncbi:type II toxin-antitoxin system VapC family toxin [Acidobacteria bacterium AH-259-L09]|nr:type II toxin-antitoxin system VapC family toxin [Acidobacteria bacterium AH-259-L09]
MILYLDTSALVKVYVQETGSREIKPLVEEAEVLATSRIAYVEARAAFARKFRERGLSVRKYRSMVEDLDQDWESYFVMDVSDSLLKAAGSLAEKHALRAFDAIHLASSLILRKQTGRTVRFSCFNERLVSAAQEHGLQVGPF